eukprot:2703682-Rhodomonas_salina.2
MSVPGVTEHVRQQTAELTWLGEVVDVFVAFVRGHAVPHVQLLAHRAHVRREVWAAALRGLWEAQDRDAVHFVPAARAPRRDSPLWGRPTAPSTPPIQAVAGALPETLRSAAVKGYLPTSFQSRRIPLGPLLHDAAAVISERSYASCAEASRSSVERVRLDQGRSSKPRNTCQPEVLWRSIVRSQHRFQLAEN